MQRQVFEEAVLKFFQFSLLEARQGYKHRLLIACNVLNWLWTLQEPTVSKLYLMYLCMPNFV